MLKFLLTLAAVVFGLMLWFGKGRSNGTQAQPRPAPPPPPSPSPPQAILSCVRCGLHLPQADAFLDDSGRAYCGAEHRRLGPADGTSR